VTCRNSHSRAEHGAVVSGQVVCRACQAASRQRARERRVGRAAGGDVFVAETPEQLRAFWLERFSLAECAAMGRAIVAAFDLGLDGLFADEEAA